jgi:hypothetical protein
MWSVVNASVAGTSHATSGAPCQDASHVVRALIGDVNVLVIAISDGAGSASHAHVGSSEAVQHLAKVVARPDLILADVTVDQVREWYGEVLTHLQTVAERDSLKLNDLACTLMLGLVWQSGALFAQIGDGAWVIEKDSSIITGTWPENGEYANVTFFITSPQAFDQVDGQLAHLQFCRVAGAITAVAGFTDGLQSLVLNYADKSANGPFFNTMFNTLRSSPDETELIAPLQQFLASDSVNARTDDDKTLVLAIWREPEKVEHAEGIKN